MKKSSLALSWSPLWLLPPMPVTEPVSTAIRGVAATQPQHWWPAKARPNAKVLYYRNPMELADTSPTPKKDSMGMDYIPVPRRRRNRMARGAVKANARLQTLGVKTAKAEMQITRWRCPQSGRASRGGRTANLRRSAPLRGWIERDWSMPVAILVKRASPCSRYIARNWSRHRRNWPYAVLKAR